MRTCALSRWRWALEKVTTGALLCAARLQPEGGGEDEGGALGDLHEAQAAEDARRETEEAEAAEAAKQAAAEAAAAEAVRGFARNRRHPSSMSSGRASSLRPPSFRFLWLYRGVYAQHRANTLEAAESALAAAEASVKTPPLVRGRHLQGMLEFVPVGRAELEAGLPVLQRPEKLRSDIRTQADYEFNRALTRGRLRVGRGKLVVEVLNVVESDEPADGSFVQVAGSSEPSTSAGWYPPGWVHNKPRVDPALLNDECTRAGYSSQLSMLTEDTGFRNQMLKDIFAPLRVARDKARALSTSMPASLSLPAIAALAQSTALARLCEPQVLIDIKQMVISNALDSTAEVQAKVYEVPAPEA